jgi:UDP-glucuronate decarboxylase
LGSHLCERLVAAGHDVICLDNFFTSQKSNVAHLIGRPNFELIRHDVTVPIFLEVDMIYNLACPAAPGHYQYNPIKTVKTSVMGAINVLGMAKRCRARVLQASTSEVYGDPEIHPQPETYRGNVNPIGPRACYDEGKRAAETLFMDYHRMNHVAIRIVRIFNTYGPRMHPFDGRVVSNFIRQALAGEQITIFGAGTQTRSFCYCDDLIEGLVRMMELESDFIGPVNLGNPVEFSICELAELVLELTGSKSKLVYEPLPTAISAGPPSDSDTSETVEYHVEPPVADKPPERKTHFTPVSEREWRSVIGTPADTSPTKRERFAIALLASALLAVVGTLVFLALPPSADKLHHRIQDSSAVSAEHDRCSRLIAEFLDRYPEDPRAAEIRQLRADLQCLSLRQELGNKVRTLTDLEQAYLEGMGWADQGQWTEAAMSFQRVVDGLKARILSAADRRLLDRSQHMLDKSRQHAQ